MKLNKEYEVVFAYGLGDFVRPQQVKISSGGSLHREVARIPIAAELESLEPSAMSRTLLAIDYETLQWMDGCSGHDSRLTAAERKKGRVDAEFQRNSMQRTISEQLGKWRCTRGLDSLFTEMNLKI